TEAFNWPNSLGPAEPSFIQPKTGGSSWPRSLSRTPMLQMLWFSQPKTRTSRSMNGRTRRSCLDQMSAALPASSYHSRSALGSRKPSSPSRTSNSAGGVRSLGVSGRSHSLITDFISCQRALRESGIVVNIVGLLALLGTRDFTGLIHPILDFELQHELL